MNDYMDPEQLQPGQSWVLLRYNGKMILDPHPFDVKFLFASKADMLRDIEFSLSRTYRCAGRIDWTVAQHSIFVSRLIKHIAPEEKWAPLDGLLHDAHEAYTGDIMSPVGRSIQGVELAKAVVQQRIEEYLNKDWVTTPRSRYLVHRCDQLAWQIESANLLARTHNDPFLSRHAPLLAHPVYNPHAPGQYLDKVYEEIFWNIYDQVVQPSFCAEFDRILEGITT